MSFSASWPGFFREAAYSRRRLAGRFFLGRLVRSVALVYNFLIAQPHSVEPNPPTGGTGEPSFGAHLAGGQTEIFDSEPVS